MQDETAYLFLLILILLIGIIGFQIYNFFQSKKAKQDDSKKSKVTLESLNKSQEDIQLNLVEIMRDLSSFRNPLNSLNRYLSRGTQAGAVGEWGLEAIISEILSSNQYEKQHEVISGSNKRVEFAIRMPEGLLLPVDSKFHSGLLDKYEEYLKASERGKDGSEQVEKIRKEIIDNIKTDAKDISSKYMQEGVTVDVGIMFIMSENIMNLIDSPDFKKKNNNISIREEVFRDYKVLIMGPNVFASYLTSVFMSFKTLAVNKRARKIIKAIGKARKEFNKFQSSTDQLIKQAESILNKAREQGVREKAMDDVLKTIEESDDPDKDKEEDNLNDIKP